jgi:protein TonB
MPPSTKENEIIPATPETAARPASTPALPGDAIKHQPVALEVPVSVNGARTIEGSDKREPFSETTKTVLVFGNGAVIRLTSSVAPGQLLFLTNEKTKKEVVCQVVKSKNYRNVSGYVELEFTEPVVGFWGMRFPGDRVGPQPVPPAPVAVRPPAVSGSPVPSRPSAPRAEESVGNIAPSIVPAKPTLPAPVSRDAQPKLSEAKFVVPKAPAAPPKSQAPVEMKPAASVVPAPPVAAVSPMATPPELSADPAPAQPITPASATFDFPRASEVQASILEPPRPAASSSPANMMASSFSPVPEVKPETPAVLPPAVVSDPETEVLKQHTARLQQQLSSLHFTETAPTLPDKPVHETPASLLVEKKEISDTPAWVSGIAKAPEPEPRPSKPAEPAVTPGVVLPASLDKEELKIPAWLEPLARNASAPSSTQELILREKARRLAEQAITEEITDEPVATVEEQPVVEMRLPSFGDELPIEEEKSSGESPSKSSGKGQLFAAIAAGILIVAAAGWWYMNQQSGALHASAALASKVQAPAVSTPAESLQPQSLGKTSPQTNLPAQTNSAEQSASSAQTNSVTASSPAANPLSVARNGALTAPARNSQPSSNPANNGTVAATSASEQLVPEQIKKPILGEVRLATPNVAKRRTAQNGAEADAGLALGNDQPESHIEALNTGLVGGNNQPAAPEAPLPVGGDVKPAKLISSVPPSYPGLAKIQHVSGNVLIDALIDANGRVTAMKVVSGPSLLHQAAMDALRQWKYQPAMLDGKATPMHLTVTIQFRLQ